MALSKPNSENRWRFSC